MAGSPLLPFGTYRGVSVQDVDLSYLRRLVEQPWFSQNYPRLYNHAVDRLMVEAWGTPRAKRLHTASPRPNTTGKGQTLAERVQKRTDRGISPDRLRPQD